MVAESVTGTSVPARGRRSECRGSTERRARRAAMPIEREPPTVESPRRTPSSSALDAVAERGRRTSPIPRRWTSRPTRPTSRSSPAAWTSTTTNTADPGCRPPRIEPGQLARRLRRSSTCPPSPDARTRSARLPRSARREQLLGAAQEVFVAQGYHAAAMDDIADARRGQQAGALPALPRQARPLPGPARPARRGDGRRGPRARWPPRRTTSSGSPPPSRRTSASSTRTAARSGWSSSPT